MRTCVLDVKCVVCLPATQILLGAQGSPERPRVRLVPCCGVSQPTVPCAWHHGQKLVPGRWEPWPHPAGPLPSLTCFCSVEPPSAWGPSVFHTFSFYF